MLFLFSDGFVLDDRHWNGTVKYLINYLTNKPILLPQFISYDEVNNGYIMENPFRGTPAPIFPLEAWDLEDLCYESHMNEPEYWETLFATEPPEIAV